MYSLTQKIYRLYCYWPIFDRKQKIWQYSLFLFNSGWVMAKGRLEKLGHHKKKAKSYVPEIIVAVLLGIVVFLILLLIIH